MCDSVEANRPLRATSPERRVVTARQRPEISVAVPPDRATSARHFSGSHRPGGAYRKLL